MSYHVMTSGRGVGFGALAGRGLGVTSSYSKKGLEPPNWQDEMKSLDTDELDASDSGNGTSFEEEEDGNNTLIIGASIVGGVVVIAGVAALAMRK